MANSPAGNTQRLSSRPSLLADTPAWGRMLSLTREPPTSRAGQMAWIVEQGVIEATGYVIVMVRADAAMASPSDPPQADVVVEPAPLSQPEPKLHPEPFG